MEIILETTNLCKSFNGQTAVNNISLNIERNSVYGLLGPNGAGKSTTLKMITGILKPTSGNIEFDGHAWKRSDLNHYSNIELKGVARYIPFSWSMNWVKDILSRQIFNYGTEKIWIAALTTGGLLLTLLWFSHWEGRKNYE